MGFEQLLQQVADARARALQAAQGAQDARRQAREENDRWVTAGVNWNGFSLESLIKMVAHKSSPAQLEALASEWYNHGGAVSRASDDLERSLTKLLQYWGGTASDEAARNVMTNARWIGALGDTAERMEGPIRDAAGALRSAQDTMPGMPKNNWLSTAGGGAAAGFAVGGPIGAAFGAAIGGIASAFGFGNKKKKMKRKAVQTMQRMEGALVSIDSTTPQFPNPGDGANPGDPTGPRPTTPIDRPGVPVVPPGGGVAGPPRTPAEGNHGTDPSFAFGPDSRWQSLTGLGPGAGGGGIPGVGTGGGGGGGGLGLGGGLGGFPPGMGGAGRPGAASARGAGAGRAGAMGGGPAGGRGAGGAGGRGAGGRGAGGRGAGGRGGAGMPGGPGGAGGRGDRDYKGRGRFNKAGALGGQGGGAGTGRRGEDEDDGEHRRTVPIEEDLFSSDQKAAPPVIGL